MAPIRSARRSHAAEARTRVLVCVTAPSFVLVSAVHEIQVTAGGCRLAPAERARLLAAQDAPSHTQRVGCGARSRLHHPPQVHTRESVADQFTARQFRLCAQDNASITEAAVAASRGPIWQHFMGQATDSAPSSGTSGSALAAAGACTAGWCVVGGHTRDSQACETAGLSMRERA